MSDVQEVELPKTGKQVVVGVKCRDCVYFNKNAIFSDKCENLGIQSFAVPCEKFVIDPNQIDFLESPEKKELAGIIKNLPDRKLAIIAALINQENKTRKKGFYFGQKVYIKIYQPDYLSNYVSAYIIAADKTHVFLQGKKGWRGTLYHKSILTIGDFKKKKLSIIAKNLIKDPKYSTYCKVKLNKTKMKTELYEPPTIDQYAKYINSKSKVLNVFSEKHKKNGVLRIRG